MDTVRLGLAIRALRRRRGWTQAQVAARASLSQAAVSRAERGDAATLTHRTLVRIADALGARVSLRLYRHGEDLDRLLDAAHAGLVEVVVQQLRDRRRPVPASDSRHDCSAADPPLWP